MSTSLYRMFQRRGTKQQWESINPVLAVGEIGFSFNENVIKLGDGLTAWNSLPSVNGNSAYEAAKINGFVGTEAQWLTSLIGPTGPSGETGPTGPTGLPGGGVSISVTGPVTLTGPSEDITLGFDETGFAKLAGATFSGLVTTSEGITNAQAKNALVASGYNSASGSFAHASRVVMTAVATGSTAPTTRPDGTALVAGDVWISF